MRKVKIEIKKRVNVQTRLKGDGNFSSLTALKIHARIREALYSRVLLKYPANTHPHTLCIILPNARMITQPYISPLRATISTYPWLMRLLRLFVRIILINGAAAPQHHSQARDSRSRCCSCSGPTINRIRDRQLTYRGERAHEMYLPIPLAAFTCTLCSAAYIEAAAIFAAKP